MYTGDAVLSRLFHILCHLYNSLKLYALFCFRFNKRLVERLSKPTVDSKDLDFPTKYSRSNFDQFVTCLWKQHLSYWRNPQYTAVRFFYTVIISLMLGSICWDFGSKRFTFDTYYYYCFFWKVPLNLLIHSFIKFPSKKVYYTVLL